MLSLLYLEHYFEWPTPNSWEKDEGKEEEENITSKFLLEIFS